MASTTESSLLSKLQSNDHSNIHTLFSDYLSPFAALLAAPNPLKKPQKTLDNQTPNVRSLAKQFLPFINSALKLLPKRLSEKPQIDSNIVSELFDTYKLCLNCLDSVNSQLACKPYSVQVQRARLLRCYEVWGRYRDAESEGFLVLESLRCIDSDGTRKAGNLKGAKGRMMPDLGNGSVDNDFAYLVVEISVTIVRCASMNKSNGEDEYRRILALVEEVNPWFRVLDANNYEKLHRVLVTYLKQCTLSLVGDLPRFNGNIARDFCATAFSEFAKSSINDQMAKFARKICSSVFLQTRNHNQSPFITDILFCVLDSMAAGCKVGMENTINEFLEIVCYCANKCRITMLNTCGALATHLNKLADDFYQVFSSPVDLILELYATGLYISDFPSHLKWGDSITLRICSVTKYLLDNEDGPRNLTVLLGLLKRHYNIRERFVYIKDSCTEIYSDASIRHQNENPYLLSYFSALKYSCQPLAEFFNSERKEVLAEIENDSFSTKLCCIQDVLRQLCEVFFFAHRTCGSDRDALDDSKKTVLSIAVAAFTQSFVTKRNVKGFVNLIKHVISSDWIQIHELTYLFSSLYNTGVVLYRNDKMNEASRALKLGCLAAWTRVLHSCEKIVNESKRTEAEFSQDSIVGFVTEACDKSAFLLDVLYQCGSHKMDRVMSDSLKNWSIAENLIKTLPSPRALVKQWVKLKLKHFKDIDEENNCTTLYSLLYSSVDVSKMTLGILLEQELQAYKERNSMNPKLCQRMQMHIIGILLEDVYISKDSSIQKSRILIEKGRALRALGAEGLKGCIQCLSDSVSIMNDMCNETHTSSIEVHHQLAEAYCLRALCTQEIEPNSKQLFQDIRAALDWFTPQHAHAPGQMDTMSRNTLTLLYYVIDLLSIKGYMKFHSDLYEMMIKLCNLKNVKLEKLVAMLWEYRRLSHALCTSPVNETFFITLSHHCGELPKSMEFWLSCMQGSRVLRLGFQRSFSSIFHIFSPGSHHLESYFGSDIKIAEVRQAATDLISSVPVPKGSAFLAAYLFYDLCESLAANGQLIEALSCAKESQRLRTLLFQENFIYSMEQQSEVYCEDGEKVHKHCYSVKTFQVSTSVATSAWPCDDITYDFEGGILTPWNVLQCLLESTLQGVAICTPINACLPHGHPNKYVLLILGREVGTIQEKLGNGSEAETLLKWGKCISVFQGLTLFTVVFSSILGKLYQKQQLWNLAKKELESAKQILDDNASLISCLKCRLVLEVTIDQQLGDLSRSRFDINSIDSSKERLIDAENIYRSALHKLNISEWKHAVCKTEELGPKSDVEEMKVEAKRTRKTRKATKPTMQIENTSRMTRSRYRAAEKGSECIPNEVHMGITKHSKENHVSACPDELGQHRGPASEIREVTCTCINDFKEYWALNNFGHMKWEFVRRRLLLRLLTSIGKCLGLRGEIHKAHEIFMESIFVLVSKCPFCPPTHSSVSFSFLLDLIEKDIKGDAFAVERAVLLYNICWFTVESYSSNYTRADCCELSRIPIPRIMSCLKLAFILCREVPCLLQKVSKLLAVLYILSTSIKPFSASPSLYKTISKSQWASYFHQASLGNHLNHQLFSSMTEKKKVQNPVDFEGSCPSTSTSISPETLDSLRLAPESVQALEGFVLKFFQRLPYTTIVCVSILGGSYNKLLKELLPSASLVRAWILLSRLNSNGQPIVVLLPVGSVIEETSEDGEISGLPYVEEEACVEKKWQCPWGSTVVDELAPLFRVILEENYVSSSTFPIEDTKEIRSSWWRQRRRLDQRLGDFLRDLEDSWFGPWKYLLLGDCSDCKHLDLIQRKLADNLKQKYKVKVAESVLKVVVGGIKYACQREECASQLLLNKGCYLAQLEDPDKFDEIESLSQSVFKLILEAASEVEEKEVTNRQPVIFVLDFEVQMLPWENLPILRNQETYRMPSVGCISVTFDRCTHSKEKLVPNSVPFPLIDPLDAYYLLNPSGDLSSTENEFQTWFRNQNLEGKTGTTPTIEELSVALKSRDLFIYLGHGSGSQYIPGREIQKLEKCAATLLMGCSSGSLSLNGAYTPQGAPLNYLLAGSPIIVANLWEVTDKDIDRFGKSMLNAWLRERSDALTGVCDQCELLSNKFKSLTINSTKGNGRSKISKKKISESCDVNNSNKDHNHYCKHRRKIGSFMQQAREACLLPFLIGASPVCYGVPTGIKKKDKLSR